MIHTETAKGAAAVVVRSGEGQMLRWGPAGKVRILAGASSTDRSFSVVECIEPPGSGAPLHVHHAEAEAFYILEGTVELTCGAEKMTARPATLSIRRKMWHTNSPWRETSRRAC